MVTDVVQLKHAKVLDGFAAPQRTPSPKARKLKRALRTSINNRTLDGWVSKSPKTVTGGTVTEEVDPLAIDKPAVRTTRASIKGGGATTDGGGGSLENGDA